MELTTDALVTSQVVDGVAVIAFSRGRIRDEREILKTLDSLTRYVASKEGLKIVLDLSQVEYLSSAGLGHLLALLKKSRARSTQLKLCRLHESIRELFEVMRLTQIFDIYEDTTRAVESFRTEATPD